MDFFNTRYCALVFQYWGEIIWISQPFTTSYYGKLLVAKSPRNKPDLFDKPIVAGDVLQTALWLIDNY